MKWHHAGIQVQNLLDSIAFYENVFDFSIEQFLSLPGEKIVFLKKGEIRIELIESGEAPVATNHIAWQVTDVGKWQEELGRKDIFPTEGPLKMSNGWEAVFYTGPNQEIIELIQVS
ncbi:lactoylglutathione lyase [Cytobacillus eiseniae]|uniref:Lactoylglutathione lyase n=1 Tax=Cytobacillus eiseniae TaxID=762947 RepID=A0ABS4RLQ6_9BACI|nr:VOC family protein [Cytobacillus eiseniae]MBP2242747.1 lactoylglutathione lyase [Cytobacillus eiseniae]